MRIADLDQRIGLLAPTITANALNEEVRAWTEIVRVWAQVREERGIEFLKAGAVQGQGRAAFRLRWRAGLSRDHRVEWRGRIYEIVDITGTRQSGEAWLHGVEIRGAA